MHGYFISKYLVQCANSPKMIGIGLLSKTRSRDDANASVFQKLECVENIRRLANFSGLGNGLWRQMKLREGVHGSLYGIAGESLHGVESISH